MSIPHVDNFGTKNWYQNNKRHRVDGPAVEHLDGSREWWLNGKRHREDGPAVEKEDGTKIWYRNDLCHRTDGPAVEWPAGTVGWYLHGVRYHRITTYCKAARITGAMKTLFLLKWDNTNVK